MGSVARWRSVTRRERPRSATTAERWRLLEAIERSRSAGGAGVSGGDETRPWGALPGRRSESDAVRRGGPARKRDPSAARPINEH